MACFWNTSGSNAHCVKETGRAAGREPLCLLVMQGQEGKGSQGWDGDKAGPEGMWLLAKREDKAGLSCGAWPGGPRAGEKPGHRTWKAG